MREMNHDLLKHAKVVAVVVGGKKTATAVLMEYEGWDDALMSWFPSRSSVSLVPAWDIWVDKA